MRDNVCDSLSQIIKCLESKYNVQKKMILTPPIRGFLPNDTTQRFKAKKNVKKDTLTGKKSYTYSRFVEILLGELFMHLPLGSYVRVPTNW